jgi:hypothetical protein
MDTIVINAHSTVFSVRLWIESEFATSLIGRWQALHELGGSHSFPHNFPKIRIKDNGWGRRTIT